MLKGKSPQLVVGIGSLTWLKVPVCLRFSAMLLIIASLSSCEKKSISQPPKEKQVGVLIIKPQPVSWTTELPGRTDAEMTAAVRPQVSGVILKRLFTEGGEVVAGQQLYQIDPAVYQASYDSAVAALAHNQAALITAQDEAQRDKPLAAAQAVSQQNYDNAVAAAAEAEANVASAQAAVEQAMINLRYTKVLAPIAGHISASSVTPGALVTANQRAGLATVTQLNPIYVDVQEPSILLLNLKQGLVAGQIQKNNGNNSAEVQLRLENNSVYPLPGTLLFNEVTEDESTGTVLLRATFPNPKHLLLPGMYVHAILRQGIHKNAIVVPQEAVSHNTHGDATVLLVGGKDRAELRIVQTGASVGDEWVVTKGLKSGDEVIVDGLADLQPGDVVKPIRETGPLSDFN